MTELNFNPGSQAAAASRCLNTAPCVWVHEVPSEHKQHAPNVLGSHHTPSIEVLLSQFGMRDSCGTKNHMTLHCQAQLTPSPVISPFRSHVFLEKPLHAWNNNSILGRHGLHIHSGQYWQNLNQLVSLGKCSQVSFLISSDFSGRSLFFSHIILLIVHQRADLCHHFFLRDENCGRLVKKEEPQADFLADYNVDSLISFAGKWLDRRS